jgi:hypothetical protein
MEVTKITDDYKPFLCEYPFDDGVWSFEIMARSQSDAEARIRAMPWASVKGELVARIPAAPTAGLFLGLTVALRNWLTR